MSTNKFSIGAVDWYSIYQGKALFKYLKESGVTHLQVSYRSLCESCSWDISSAALQTYRECSQKFAINLSALAINLTNEVNIFSGNKNSLRKLKTVLQQAVSAAKFLDIGVIIIPSFHSNLITNLAEIRATVKILNFACRISYKEGIVIASESSLGSENIGLMLSLMQHDNFRILLDPYNCCVYNVDPIAIIDNHYPSLLDQVHLKDGDLISCESLPLGCGKAPIRAVLSSLEKRNFKGMYFLENKYRSFPERICKDVAYVRDYFVNLSGGLDE
jgi:sugar phosphate isomerase/epimerase